MNRSLAWRGVVIVAVVAMAALMAYPPQEKINLGLDLRGGIHLVLEVQTEDALAAERDKDIDRLLRDLEEQGLEGISAQAVDDNSFRVLGVASDREQAVEEIANEHLSTWEWRRSGGELLFERDQQEISTIYDQAVRQALQTIRNRVDQFGVAEPVIQRQGLGSNRVVLQLPGVDDPERVKKVIKNTAFLEFQLVDYPSPGQEVTSRDGILAHYGGTLPESLELLDEDIYDQVTGERIGRRYYAVERRQVITGRDLKGARSEIGQFGDSVVGFTLTPEGGRIFGRVTEENIGRGLAIVLDDKVVSAPRLNSRIVDSGIIEGNFTQEEVDDLVTVLRSGALPAAIKYLEERTVGPTLGQDSIDQGLRAFLVGAVLVVVTMLVVYKGAGINAVLALTLNFVLVFGMLSYFNATLTLPGIAGIILTIGMAVDANVLIFERIREELRHGRTVKSGVVAGFSKALSSILDANVTTLIAATLLFSFGTGPIRGFAVTLSIGILASVFTAVFNSRWIFDLILSRRRRVERLSI